MSSNIAKKTNPPPSRNTTRLYSAALVLLPLLSIAGAYGTMVLGGSNGTFKELRELLTQKIPLFPGSDAALLKHYTGVKAIDRQLLVLVTFFAPVVDQGYNDLTLFSIEGAGQFGAAWTLLLMESLRRGNKGKLVSFIGTVGLFIQNISFTITVPLYLALHLLTSPVAKPGAQRNGVLYVSAIDLKIIPVSIVLGYIVPTVLMTLPSPSVVSPFLHQWFIAIWQPFPVWTVIAQWTIRYLLGGTKSDSDIINKPSPAAETNYLTLASSVHRFVLLLSMVTHLPVLALTLLSSDIISKTNPGLASLSQSTFADVFVPRFPSLGNQTPSFAAGVLTFLQWDLYIGSAALLLWAVVLHRSSWGSVRSSASAWVKLASSIIVWTLVSGPAGTVSVLLQERDRIVEQKSKGA